jgi:hypothetical protein
LKQKNVKKETGKLIYPVNEILMKYFILNNKRNVYQIKYLKEKNIMRSTETP